MTPQEDSEESVPAFFRGASNRPEVIAHRGGGGEWPGETLFAFERALEAGADVLEMDAHSTRDGRLVLLHNKTLEQTTNGRGKVKEHTWDEIKNLDAGYRWTADGATFPFRTEPGREVPPELRIARLEDVFERFKDRRPPVRMNVEIKQTSPSIAKALYDLIVKHGVEDSVLVACGRGGPMREFREVAKGRVATSATVWEMIKFRWLKHVFGGRVEGLGYEAIQTSSTAFMLELVFVTKRPFRLPFITRKYLETARRFPVPVHGWTVNHPDEMARLIHLGVDGIITDYPSALLALLGRGPLRGVISDE
jgi:glycerophosphoryl diester phosphodiesterase